MPKVLQAVFHELTRLEVSIRDLELELSRNLAAGDQAAKSATLAKLSLLRRRDRQLKACIAEVSAMQPKRLPVLRKRQQRSNK